MVRDPLGAKMSKTLGNVVDPLGVIEEVGADALRFALINGTAPGVDSRLGQSRLEGARNFGNKLWNACRFVLGARPASIADAAYLELPPASRLGPADHWILDRCAATIEAVDRAYETFQFGEAARLLHDAIWSEYCDWYLELAKVELASEDEDRRRATWQVLSWVLDRYLRLLHPFMPHLTEELWGRLPHRSSDPDLLIVAPWPDPAAAAERGLVDREAADAVDGIIELVGGIRNARAEAGIEPGLWLTAAVLIPDAGAREVFELLLSAVSRLGRVRPVLVADGAALDAAGESLTVLARVGEARLARAGADVEREQARLRKELGQAEAALLEAQRRLSDERFLERAPESVVEGVRSRVTDLEDRVARLRERLGS
jgi:valyl-tRNA synthetase